MKKIQTTACALTLLLCSAGFSLKTTAQDNGIADRPEKLSFPPLNYEPPAQARFRVTLPTGPIAYVLPDRELPLVNIAIYVKTGEYLDPAGQEGLADLTGYLLTHSGTKSKSADALEERLAFLAAHLSSAVSGSQGSVTLNLLSKDVDEGLGILREVLTAPRFQADKIELRKQQLLQDMQQRNDDSSGIEGREAGFLAYGEHFWENRQPTAASIQSITPADLAAFHQAWFYPSNLIVAVNGDFDRAEMIGKLNALFSGWPFAGKPPVAVPTNTVFAAPGVYLVNKPEVNQGRVSMLLPGVRRDNPDYFAVAVMNDILGGGFNSRIVNRVRGEEGLAYDAHSTFAGGTYYPLTFSVGFQSKSRTVGYAASLAMEEIRRIAAEPVSDQELNTSKHGFIDRFPRAFATKGQTAAIFAQDEFTGRYATHPDYWKNYRSRLAAVTGADVQRVARKYLTLDKLVILAVGNKEEMLLGQPGHPVKLQELTGGKFTELPLRDPLTMRPLPLSPAK